MTSLRLMCNAAGNREDSSWSIIATRGDARGWVVGKITFVSLKCKNPYFTVSFADRWEEIPVKSAQRFELITEASAYAETFLPIFDKWLASLERSK